MSKLQDTRTQIKIYLSFRSHPFVTQIQCENQGLHCSPYCWPPSRGLRLTDQSCSVCLLAYKKPLHQFLFPQQEHSKELFTGAEVVLHPFCFPLRWDVSIVLVK